VKVHLSRWVCLEAGTNLNRLAEESAQAANSGAELVVFPESFLHGYTQTVEPRRARAVFREASGSHPGTTFVFGTFTEDRRNRLTVWRAGREIARYDKVHLFGPNDEAALWDPGDRYSAVTIGPLTIGLLTCNDVRFPEQARELRLKARCDLLVLPAWWPWRRDDVWRTLLAARAIENGVWVIGCCIAASEMRGERFAGAGNYVFDPHGAPVRTEDDRGYELDLACVRPPIVDPLETYREVGDVQIFAAT